MRPLFIAAVGIILCASHAAGEARKSVSVALTANWKSTPIVEEARWAHLNSERGGDANGMCDCALGTLMRNMRIHAMEHATMPQRKKPGVLRTLLAERGGGGECSVTRLAVGRMACGLRFYCAANSWPKTPPPHFGSLPRRSARGRGSARTWTSRTTRVLSPSPRRISRPTMALRCASRCRCATTRSAWRSPGSNGRPRCPVQRFATQCCNTMQQNILQPTATHFHAVQRCSRAGYNAARPRPARLQRCIATQVVATLSPQLRTPAGRRVERRRREPRPPCRGG